MKIGKEEMKNVFDFVVLWERRKVGVEFFVRNFEILENFGKFLEKFKKGKLFDFECSINRILFIRKISLKNTAKTTNIKHKLNSTLFISKRKR